MKKSYNSILSVENFWAGEMQGKLIFAFSRFFFIVFFFIGSHTNAADANLVLHEIKSHVEKNNFTHARVICENLSKRELHYMPIKFFCAQAYTREQENEIRPEKRDAQLRENQRRAQMLFTSLIAVLEPIEEKKSKDKVSPLLLQSYFYRGVSLFLVRNYDAAIFNFKQLLSFDPQNRGALFNLSICLQEKGEPSQAQIYSLRLHDLDKNFISNHLLSPHPNN